MGSRRFPLTYDDENKKSSYDHRDGVVLKRNGNDGQLVEPAPNSSDANGELQYIR